MSKKGQPPYQPTPADRATVQNLAALGATHERIAKCIGTHGIDQKTLRKHFRRELDTSLDEVKALAMSKLIALINDSNLGAICFFLKCKAGFRETSNHRLIDDAGKDRGILTIADIHAAQARADARERELAAIVSGPGQIQ